MAREEENLMGMVKRCYRCYKIGHLTSQCPKEVGGRSRTGPARKGEKLTGTVTDWDRIFGFIEPSDGGEKIPFCDAQVGSPLLRVGDMVEYYTFIEHYDYGAINVTALPREGTCNICRFTGHDDQDCPGKGKRCRFCAEYGHTADICPNDTGEQKCYTCNKLGHLTHECPEFRGRSRKGGGDDRGVCFGCGREGHSARWCRYYFDKNG